MQATIRTWPSRLVARPWLTVFVPVNAATSGFGVALPLLILLSLHGSWVDVALAGTLFNIAVIVASMLWGYLSDRFPKRRLFLLINFGGFALVYLALAVTTSLPLLLGLYAVVGFLAPAGTSASNLLVLEEFSLTERASAYASFQTMTMIGSILGLLAGYFWLTGGLALPPLLYLLAGLAAVATVGAAVAVKDPTHPLSTAAVARHPESLASRVRHTAERVTIPFFPVRPKLTAAAWARFRRWLREEAHHELPLILAASFLFNLSANLFNISYTPYMVTLGIGAASIFLVNFSNNFAQTVAFPLSGSLNSRLGADRLVRQSSYARAVGYLAVAGFTFVPLTVASAFGANVVAFGILGVAIAFYTTSSSLILFRALEGRDAPTLLGFNSALGGTAAVAGTGLSAILSVFGSFRLVFLVSAAALLASLPLWTAAQVASVRKRAPRARGDEEHPLTAGRTSGAKAE